ncbi:substrate-binding periplasmic protein [Parachitinimonas caeni]|uniref:ABC transporter substrate-binding protein n=1 Tax=Parachitinimonas caeni TaxID=3031301 RepID=A0ABT7E1D8_9NEIS|nr:ABC transporter substrate-binding protein [Parachitinimonas caeni]MDK2125859.1 ABC transporter substrate-binding protein [Parachitinimonas caeni]
MNRGALIGLAMLVALPAAAESMTVNLANGEWPPYLGEKLPNFGSASRIVSEAFKAQDVKVEYKFYPWKRAFEVAKNGELDGTLVWTKNAEREADFLISEPIYNSKVVLLYLKDKPLKWNKLSDLSTNKFGGTIGYNYGKEWEELEKAKKLSVDRIPSDEQNIAKVVGGRIDGFPVELDVGVYMTQLHHGKEGLDKVTYSSKTLHEEPMYLLISKKSAKAAEIIKRFNAGLAKLKSSGKVEQFLSEGRVAK